MRQVFFLKRIEMEMFIKKPLKKHYINGIIKIKIKNY